MDFKKMGEEIVAKALTWGAGEAEACLEKVNGFMVNVRNGEIETLTRSVTRGLGLRTFIDKQLGFAYTSDLTSEAVDETIKKAIELARITESLPWLGLPDFGPQTPVDLDLFDNDLAAVGDDQKIAIAREAEKIALASDPRITKSWGSSFRDSEREFGLFSSKGISNVMRETRCSFSVEVIAGEGNKMQDGSWSSVKRFFKELAPVEKVAKTAAKRAVERMDPKPVKAQKVPIIFDSRAASTFWWGICSALNGYAALQKSTFLADSLGEAIVSPLITVVDNPTIPRFVQSVPFDGEGRVTRKNLVIDKGVLKMFVYSSQSARRAGTNVNTITNRRDYMSSPTASFLNIIVENGQDSYEALFKDIKEGLYVQTMRSLGTNGTTGNFSTGCSGFWIVDGAIAHPVDGVTLGGSALEILKSIDKVADDLDMYGQYNSPSFRVAEVTVGGRNS